MSTRSSNKCVICNRRRTSNSGVFLASLPIEPDRCKLWVQAIGQEDLVYLPIEKLHELKFVCALHFDRNDFNEKGNRLRKLAVPSLLLPFPPLREELFKDFPFHVGFKRKQLNVTDQSYTKVYDAETTADASIAAIDLLASTSNAKGEHLVRSYKRKIKSSQDHAILSPRENKLLKRLGHAKCSLKTLANTSINVDKLESQVLKNIILNAVKNYKKKPNGKRWDMENKISALEKKIKNLNILDIAHLEFLVNVNMAWFVCEDHHSMMSKTLFNLLSTLFIRRQCKIINNKFAMSENQGADSTKKAQQQSKAK